MNRHQFEQAAKHFRAGRLTLSDFSAQVFPEQHPAKVETGTVGAEETTMALPSRSPEAHKGDFGRVLAVGGSVAMPGAIGLSGLAALRSGSGLVVIVTPPAAAPVVASFSPCYMTQACEWSTKVPSEIEELINQWANVIAIGPGMGTDDATVEWVTRIYRDAPQPVVVDADGLNCLSKAGVDLGQHQGPRILTPHPGEFNRLTGKSTKHRDELESEANEMAKQAEVTVVLKGHRTYVSDGKQFARNSTGNVGMATGGSGDVLTGVIASLIGQGVSVFSAARLGCHIHGLSGDLAAESLGQVSLISSDLLEFLPKAILKTGKK